MNAQQRLNEIRDRLECFSEYPRADATRAIEFLIYQLDAANQAIAYLQRKLDTASK